MKREKEYDGTAMKVIYYFCGAVVAATLAVAIWKWHRSDDPGSRAISSSPTNSVVVPRSGATTKSSTDEYEWDLAVNSSDVNKIKQLLRGTERKRLEDDLLKRIYINKTCTNTAVKQLLLEALRTDRERNVGTIKEIIGEASTVLSLAKNNQFAATAMVGTNLIALSASETRFVGVEWSEKTVLIVPGTHKATGVLNGGVLEVSKFEFLDDIQKYKRKMPNPDSLEERIKWNRDTNDVIEVSLGMFVPLPDLLPSTQKRIWP